MAGSRSLLRSCSAGVLLFALGALTACSARGAGTGGSGEAQQDSRLITAEEIRNSSAKTAWDALRLVARLHLTESARGAPMGVRTRGHSSFHLDDSPVLVVDGVRIRDFRYLRSIDARSVSTIEVINGVQGTLRYGTGSGGGAIVVTTRNP